MTFTTAGVLFGSPAAAELESRSEEEEERQQRDDDRRADEDVVGAAHARAALS